MVFAMLLVLICLESIEDELFLLLLLGHSFYGDRDVALVPRGNSYVVIRNLRG
jgi:hypothetical protein